jgi:hypothetical protein
MVPLFEPPGGIIKRILVGLMRTVAAEATVLKEKKQMAQKNRRKTLLLPYKCLSKDFRPASKLIISNA